MPLENDIQSHLNLLLQRYEERTGMLSQENKVSKFCMDAGFISVVEIGQYFMTKDTEEQFFAKACREYTLPRNDESSQPKGWIQGNTKIGPALEITTSCLYGKHGIEIRIWSLRKDNTQSWVRISHVNAIHPEPEIHEHFMIQEATEHCAQPQAHSQQRGAQCDQLREQHDAHRRDDRAALSTLRAVCRCVI